MSQKCGRRMYMFKVFFYRTSANLKESHAYIEAATAHSARNKFKSRIGYRGCVISKVEAPKLRPLSQM